MENPALGVFVVFYNDVVEIKAESEKQGRPIYKEMAFIRKVIPGDTTNVVERVAKQHDFDLYPKEYDRYKRETVSGSIEGTPLEQWPQISRSQVKEAKYFEVHTVEQLANLTDSNCQKMGMGFVELRSGAKSYLNLANDTAAATAQAAENQRLREDIDALQAQLAQIGSVRGRPRKETAEA